MGGRSNCGGIKMHLQRILAAISFLLLSACGGGGGGSAGGGSPSPTTLTPTIPTIPTAPTTKIVSGVVADGYLSGATVCLDINGNKQCDSNEPTGSSGTGGAYSIPNVTDADLAQYPIVVVVPIGAIDSERGNVTSEYILTAPTGKPEFISPLTTLVQSKIEYGGATLTDAVAAVKSQLGLLTLSPLDDYKPGVSGASPEAVVAAGVAKVIATTIANSTKNISAVVSSSSTTAIQQVIMQQVSQNISTVVLQVKSSTNNGTTALPENGVAAVVSNSGVMVNTSNTSALQQLLATATNPSSIATTMKLTITLSGSSASSVMGVQAVVALPSGIVIRADSTGAPLAGVLTTTGSASGGLINGKYAAATSTTPATLTIGLMTTSGLSAGDIISFNAALVSTATSPSTNNFIISYAKLTDTNGYSLSGATLGMK